MDTPRSFSTKIIPSLDRTHQLLQAVGVVVMTLRRHGEITYTSLAIQALAGYRPEELLNTSLDTLIAPDWQEEILATLNRQFEQAISEHTIEFPILTKTGETRWIRQTALLVSDLDEPQVHCLLQEIPTPQPTSEENDYHRLMQEHELLLNLLNNLPEYIRIRDLNGRYIFVNTAYHQAVGFDSPDELVGKSVFEILPPEKAEQHHKEDQDVARIGQPFLDYRDPLTMPDGEEHIYSINKIPLRNTDQEIVGIIGIGRDITTQKLAEQKLQKSEQRQRALLEAIPDMMFVVTREGRFIDYQINTDHPLLVPQEQITELGLQDLPLEKHMIEDGLQAIEAVLDTGTTQFINYQLVVDGQSLEYDAHLIAKSDDEVLIIARNMTEQRETEHEIHKREEQYRTLARNLPQSAVYLFDRDMRYSIAEGPLLAEHGFSSDMIEGKTLQETSSNARFQQLAPLFQQALDGQNAEVEYLYNEHVLFTRIVPIFDEQKEVIGGISLTQDITNRRQAEQRLQKSEETIRVLLDALPDTAILVSPMGTIITINDMGAKRLGKTADELIGIKSTDFMPAVLRQARQQHFDTVLATKKSVKFEDQRMGHYFEITMAPILDAEENILQVAIFARDITLYKQVYDELNRRVDTLFDIEEDLAEIRPIEQIAQIALNVMMEASRADVGFIALQEGEQFRLLQKVGAYPDIIHLTDCPILNQAADTHDAILEKDSDENPDFVSMIPQMQARITIPFDYQDQIHGIINLETSTIEAFDDETFTFLQRMTQRIAGAIKNVDRYQQISSLEQLKTDMIRIAAHDLKNRLTAINGHVQLLREDTSNKLSASQQEYVHHIKESSIRMQHIVRSILSVERIKELSEQQSMEAVNLTQLVQEGYEQFMTLETAANKVVMLDSPPEEAMVSGDPFQLTEAIINLIDNAGKYTPHDSTIIISLTATETTTQFRVEDTGYGIPEDKQAQLFEPFYRAKSRETRNIQGIGLGLHLVKNIIERHHGNMVFHSVYGEGSTFGFDLPLAEANTS